MKTIARTVMGYRRKRRLGRRKRLPRKLIVGMRARRAGGARRRRVGARRRLGRVHRGGFLGSILKGIHSVARSVPLVSAGLAATGNPMAAGVARSLGYGRRRRVRKGGILGRLVSGLLGMRKKRRRVRRGGFKRRGTVSFGGYRRRGQVVFGGVRSLRRVPRRPAIAPRLIRRSGMRRVRRGRGIMDMLKKAHSFAKEHKLVSRGLAMIPHKYGQMASSAAHALGYGRRARRARGAKRRVRRGGFMGIIPLAMRGRRRHKRRRHLGMRRKRRGMRYLPNVSHF